MTPREIEQASISKEMKDCLRLMRQTPTLYNLQGLVPTTCRWIIKTDDMERFAYRIAREHLGDEVRMVTIEPGAGKTVIPKVYVWMKADCRHLMDKSKGRNQEAVIQVRVERFSEELKRFADLFAPTHRDDGTPINRKKRIILAGNERGDKSIKAVQVDLVRLCRVMFDLDNRGFQDMFGTDAPNIRCDLTVDARWIKRNDSLYLTHIIVEKSLPGGRSDKDRPSPTRNFSDRSDRDRDGRRNAPPSGSNYGLNISDNS